MCPARRASRNSREGWSGPSERDGDRARRFVRRCDDRADVMRGEEVQLLGAHAAGMVAADALVCHPGTHNKWARLDGGRIARFRR